MALINEKKRLGNWSLEDHDDDADADDIQTRSWTSSSLLSWSIDQGLLDHLKIKI